MSAADVSLPTKKRARELLLEAAARLFYARGVGATGIDAITAEAGVAKKSLYNNFASKSDLVAAYLEARHEEWLGLYQARVDGAAGPRERVLAVFDAYVDHARFAYEHGFRGCGLLNAAAELPAGSPGRLAVWRHKEEVEALLAGHLGELLPGQDERGARLGAHLAFVLEGAMVRAGLEGGDARLLEGRTIAAQMLAGL
ncbi:AcrR family transcriptional regulator [Pseudarthrobacter siccitolerans]|uniref:AcrR family transcriptional regulator n=1 Tax=Pseudarthrobacter siccitolerans TaxID=861266 RepID=A0ABU0PNE6_9MICC|nr:TetR/AcrR family transcriptional regulator [Pseudarthrobacter siccitolerans]MDQ0675468.1 AcrR family transcriptional regulator [Pseudarthrobacter siccitolerans]